MYRKTTQTVASLIAACMLLCLQVGSQANTFHRAVVNGRYHLNSSVATGINVNAYSTYYSATGFSVPGGTVTISSDVLNIHAGVSSVVCDTVNVGGWSFGHATVTSTAFVYQGVSAHAVIELAPISALGSVGFQIVRNSDGAILTASWPNGFYQMLPLEWGGISIA